VYDNPAATSGAESASTMLPDETFAASAAAPTTQIARSTAMRSGQVRNDATD
jgi:hypothetical protein